MVRRARRHLQQVWNVEWKRATFAWKECSSPYQPGRNVKAEYREVQHDLQNIRRYHIDVGPVGPRCMELPHDRFHGTYLQRLRSGRMEGLERCGPDSEVVGAQGLHRTRRPERRARGWELSLGNEI